MKISHSGLNVGKITVKLLERSGEIGGERAGGGLLTFFIRSPTSRIPRRPQKQMEFCTGPFIHHHFQSTESLTETSEIIVSHRFTTNFHNFWNSSNIRELTSVGKGVKEEDADVA